MSITDLIIYEFAQFDTIWEGVKDNYFTYQCDRSSEERDPIDLARSRAMLTELRRHIGRITELYQLHEPGLPGRRPRQTARMSNGRRFRTMQRARFTFPTPQGSSE